MDNFIQVCQFIETKFNETPYWVLLKYGLLMGLKGLKEINFSETPGDWKLFNWKSGFHEEAEMLEMMWDRSLSKRGISGSHSLWAKLLAFGLGNQGDYLTESEEAFINLLMNKPEKVYVLGEVDKGLLECLCKTVGVKLIECEDWKEIPYTEEWVLDSLIGGSYSQVHLPDELLAWEEFKAKLVRLAPLSFNPSIEVSEFFSLLTPRNFEGVHKVGGYEWKINPVSSTHWKETLLFPEVNRESRYYVVNDQIVEGLEFSLWVYLNLISMETSDGEIRQCLYRDATDLLAPATNYGSPSSLNTQVALGDVGFLEVIVHQPDAYDYLGDFQGLWGLPRNQEFPLRELFVEKFQELGIPVLPHHQMSHLRVGPIAAGVGISYLANGEGVIISDKSVDKVHKIPNRFSLQTRTAAGLKVAILPLEKLDLNDW